MSESIISPILAEFLTAYMAVELSLPSAVRVFRQQETKAAVDQLALAVKETLGKDLPPTILDREIASLTDIALSTRRTGHDFLLELFAELMREGGVPRTLRAYDVFVSYSSPDIALASWLASELRARGYSVWLDRDEILVGHSILDEVYRGIRESEFLIVLLTKNSVRSRWVREELTSARLRELQHDHVVVLPVKCDAEIEIPEVLRTKRWADFSRSREAGVAELTRAIDVHRAQAAVEPLEDGAAPVYTRLTGWAADITGNLVQYGYDPTKGYKDVLVGTGDGEEARLDRRRLLGLLDRARIRIRGWGGPPFPYEARRAELANVDDGIYLSDKETWPYSEWNFYFWRASTTGRFFQRSGLNEDGDVGPDGEARLRGCLYVGWVLKDICTALMFASRLLGELPSLRRLIMMHRLLGMNGRRLISSRLSRWGAEDELICRMDSMEQVAIVTRDTDLEAEAGRIARDVFWLFNWRNPPENLIQRDVRSFISGAFPSPGL